jgi:7-cyano-7-deazaguanine synthase
MSNREEARVPPRASVPATPCAVILLSGGLDSATTLAMARADGMECHALTLSYGQRHHHEIACARRTAAAQGVAGHLVLDLDLASIGGSSLLGAGEIPKTPQPGIIPSTYVPARNTIFLSLALGWAEVLHADAIYLGVNAIDYSGYPDCRPEYLSAFGRLARLATRRGVEGHPVEIRAPLIHLSKAQIVSEGRRLGVDFSLTSSCYDPGPDGSPCGLCDSCRLREQGFRDAGFQDPLVKHPN